MFVFLFALEEDGLPWYSALKDPGSPSQRGRGSCPHRIRRCWQGSKDAEGMKVPGGHLCPGWPQNHPTHGCTEQLQGPKGCLPCPMVSQISLFHFLKKLLPLQSSTPFLIWALEARWLPFPVLQLLLKAGPQVMGSSRRAREEEEKPSQLGSSLRCEGDPEVPSCPSVIR